MLRPVFADLRPLFEPSQKIIVCTQHRACEMEGIVVKGTFVHLINFVPGDSEVLRTSPLRKSAERYKR